MATAANIVINDGQGTPAAHTFVPARKDGQIVVWEERVSAATSNGFYTITISQTPPSGKSPVIRTKVSLAVPIESYDSTTQLYSYPGVMRMNLDVLIPAIATLAKRADLAAYCKNLLAQALFTSLVKDLDAPY